jgi:uncharacterized DUF497 family protein
MNSIGYHFALGHHTQMHCYVRGIFFLSGGLAFLNNYMYNVHMTLLQFQWEPRKASANFKKHGVSFEEAKSVFYDERAKLISDPDHSENEDRFILLGVSHSLRVILVCHCYRSEGNVIRIISARKASAKESTAY